MPLGNVSEQDLSDLPTGTVTLLLADVEGSAQLWENQPEAMTSALETLDQTVDALVGAHGGVRPIEQGEGDSFVAAFSRASAAVACALELQRAPLGPIRIRIGIHSGEVQLRDEGNYIGSTVNRAARLRDLAHGGQTVLSGATEALVIDRLPAEAWLTDLGVHALRGLLRPERVVQLNHSDSSNDFPPLRTANHVVHANFPAQLTRFVGRATLIEDVRRLVLTNRLVTLTGAGGVGKTRLAVEVATAAMSDFSGGIWFVDLAPVVDPAVVPLVVARGLGLADQPGRSSIDALSRFVCDRKVLLVLDNCEHLLDASGSLIVAVLNAGPGVTVLATSREPIGIPGELTWRVPSLSLDDHALELFVDRARLVRPDFTVTKETSALIEEICRRLDGVPLALELAAARLRTLSLTQIVEGLHQSFRVLTGGARTAVRRQQTLRASVDWSHAMLTGPERILFRRLAVFMGHFDLDAAHAVGDSTDIEGFQLMDLLGLLVDKSLVVAEEFGGAMRYRLLETVRQYGLEKLGESGEADTVRARHRDYYTVTAAALESHAGGAGTSLIRWAEAEIDNLRAAHAWSCETADFSAALSLVSSLERLWLRRGRFREGLAGFDAVFTDERYRDVEVEPATWVRAVADAAILGYWCSVPFDLQRAEKALDTARGLADQSLIVRALTACGMVGFFNAELAVEYLAEAVDVARESGDWVGLYHVRAYQCHVGSAAGAPIESQTAGEEGRDIADSCGDAFMSRYSRVFLSGALMMQGKLAESLRVSRSLVDEARAAGDTPMETFGLICMSQTLACRGDSVAAHSAAQAALENASAMGGFHDDTIWVAFASAALAGGDAAAAKQACDAAWQHTYRLKELFTRSLAPTALAAMGCGDLVAARQWADATVAAVPGSYRVWALVARARVAIAQGEPAQAERDAHEALEIAVRTGGYLRVPDALECLAIVAANVNARHAARLFGAANAIRERHGEMRLKAFQADYEQSLAASRDALGDKAFHDEWIDGAALSIEETIAYARRGRGQRRRPTSGWESLTPTERDVIKSVRDGLSNRDVAARLFISPRTVQTHLTRIYAKLGVSSRTQLVKEAARHT